MTQAKAKSCKPALWPLAALLVAALLLVATTGSALAGTGGNTSGHGAKKGSGTTHGKCKKKPKGKAGSSTKRKCGKKKHGQGKNPPKPPVVTPPATPPVVTPPAAPPVVTPPPATTTLAIDPASFDFGNVPHGGFAACQPDPDPDCPTHAFTVTNTGGGTSGVPSASIVELHNSEIGGPAAFAITADSCTAELAAGASCAITVKFAPNSNAGDEMFSSRLEVTASPGSTVSSSLTGMAG